MAISKNTILSNNLEKNVKIKTSVNYEQVFLFQKNLMLIIDEKDSLAHTNKDIIYKVLSYSFNIPSEIYKTVHFDMEYVGIENCI